MGGGEERRRLPGGVGGGDVDVGDGGFTGDCRDDDDAVGGVGARGEVESGDGGLGRLEVYVRDEDAVTDGGDELGAREPADAGGEGVALGRGETVIWRRGFSSMASEEETIFLTKRLPSVPKEATTSSFGLGLKRMSPICWVWPRRSARIAVSL